ncbi:MAG: LON peptidase substrate-binding domain-containing protein [Pseudobdellovibrio sp.]
MPRQKTDYFLFPMLNVNFFPSTTKPLQIFEERYIQMIQDSIADKKAVAICFVPEGSNDIMTIAGYGYPQIIETRTDGTMVIFINCVGKVNLELNKIKAIEPYMIASGEVITQDNSVSETNKPLYLKLSQVLARWINKNVSDPAQAEIFMRSLVGPAEVISAFAAYLVVDYDFQYELMQIHTLDQQIEILYRLLESGGLTNK